MNRTQLLDLLADGPVIAAVKDNEGLAAALESDVAVIFLLYGDVLTIARNTAADGVISTKAPLTKRGRELGLVAIQRFFLLDSMALRNIERHLAQDSSDLIEVLPGLMPKIIRRVIETTGKPIIAGGLISDKEDVTGALGAGAVAVSSTNPAVWAM